MLLECVNSSNNKLCCQVLLLLFFLFCCYCRRCLNLIIDRHAWRKRRAASAAGQAAVAFQNRVPKLSGRCVARERERERREEREGELSEHWLLNQIVKRRAAFCMQQQLQIQIQIHLHLQIQLQFRLFIFGFPPHASMQNVIINHGKCE